MLWFIQCKSWSKQEMDRKTFVVGTYDVYVYRKNLPLRLKVLVNGEVEFICDGKTMVKTKNCKLETSRKDYKDKR